MLAHCFNPQVERGRVQSSNWPARLSIRIKRFYTVSDIHFIFVRLITILSFKIRSPLNFWGLFSQTRAIYLYCKHHASHMFILRNVNREKHWWYSFKMLLINQLHCYWITVPYRHTKIYPVATGFAWHLNMSVSVHREQRFYSACS